MQTLVLNPDHCRNAIPAYLRTCMHYISFISAGYFFPCPGPLGNSHSVQPRVSARKTLCTTWLAKLMVHRSLLTRVLHQMKHTVLY